MRHVEQLARRILVLHHAHMDQYHLDAPDIRQGRDEETCL